MARLIGVPVVSPGRSTVFDKAPASLAGADLAKWEKKKFALLAEGLPGQRGVAFNEFMKVLVNNLDTLAKRARGLVELFQAKVSRSNMTQVELDIVAKFGVLFAGGILAIEAQILPLDGTKLASTVRRACRAALSELPKPRDQLRADLAHLREKLCGGSILNVEDCSRKRLRLMRDADGFRERKSSGEVFVVRAQVLTELFRSQLRTRLVLEWLDDEGLLQHSRDRKLGRSNLWATKRVSWPNNTRVRSISIFLPNGAADLEI